MDTQTKDMCEVAAWIVAAVGGSIAAWQAILQMRRANVEREEQGIWRRAEMARTILDQLWGDKQARCAIKMLDWDGLTYDRPGGRTTSITHEMMDKSLRTTNTRFTEDEQFVRDCFDQFFDGLERIEHDLRIELIDFDDVSGRLQYYVDLLAERKAVMAKFLDKYKFKLASALLARFSSWTSAGNQTPRI